MDRLRLVFLITALGIASASAQNINPGGGSGGGGGAVTVADGADVTQGATTDAASSAGGTGTVSAKLREMSVQLGAIQTAVAAPLVPPSGTLTETSVSCGTSSTTLLAAAAATQFILVKVPSTAANIVWVNSAGAAAVQAAGSLDLTPGASLLWSTPGYVPTTQLACIAASATTVTLMYK